MLMYVTLTFLVFLFALSQAIPPILLNNGVPRLHLLSYFELSPTQIQFVSSHFHLVLGVFDYAENVALVKEQGSVVTIGYHIFIEIIPEYEHWEYVNQQEDFFLHDRTTGLFRLRNEYYGSFYLDISNSDYQIYTSNLLRDKTEEYSTVFDGIYVDNVMNEFYSGGMFAEIKNETSKVEGDGITIITQFDIWENPYQKSFSNWEHISVVKLDGTKLLVDSFDGKNIILSTLEIPDTIVFLDYSGYDNELLIPPEEKLDSWNTDMRRMLENTKDELNDELLIINCQQHCTYYDLTDGIMFEKWLLGFVNEQGDWEIDFLEWRYGIESFQRIVNDKDDCIVVVSTQMITKDGEYDQSEYDNQFIFHYSSYLLGLSDYSNFYFSNVTAEYQTLSYDDIFEVDIGLPIDEYYVYFENYTNYNFIPTNENPYFEDMTGWYSGSFLREVNFELQWDEYIGNNVVCMFPEVEISSGGVLQSLEGILEPNSSYTFSGWIKTENLTTEGGMPAYIYVQENTITQKVHFIGFLNQLLVENERWVFFSSNFTTLSVIDTPLLGFIIDKIRIGGKAWFGNIILEKRNIERERIEVYSRSFSKATVFVNPRNTKVEGIPLFLEESNNDFAYTELGSSDQTSVTTLSMNAFCGKILKIHEFPNFDDCCLNFGQGLTKTSWIFLFFLVLFF